MHIFSEQSNNEAQLEKALYKAIMANQLNDVESIVKQTKVKTVQYNDTQGRFVRESALHVAAAHGKVEIVSILLAHAYGPIFRPSGMKVSFRNIFN